MFNFICWSIRSGIHPGKSKNEVFSGDDRSSNEESVVVEILPKGHMEEQKKIVFPRGSNERVGVETASDQQAEEGSSDLLSCCSLLIPASEERSREPRAKYAQPLHSKLVRRSLRAAFEAAACRQGMKSIEPG